MDGLQLFGRKRGEAFLQPLPFGGAQLRNLGEMPATVCAALAAQPVGAVAANGVDAGVDVGVKLEEGALVWHE